MYIYIYIYREDFVQQYSNCGIRSGLPQLYMSNGTVVGAYSVNSIIYNILGGTLMVFPIHCIQSPCPKAVLGPK